jgi:hypothetical protein
MPIGITVVHDAVDTTATIIGDTPTTVQIVEEHTTATLIGDAEISVSVGDTSTTLSVTENATTVTLVESSPDVTVTVEGAGHTHPPEESTVLNYTDGLLTSVVGLVNTTTLTYDGDGILQTVTRSFDGVVKTLGYTSGILTSVTVS